MKNVIDFFANQSAVGTPARGCNDNTSAFDTNMPNYYIELRKIFALFVKPANRCPFNKLSQK